MRLAHLPECFLSEELTVHLEGGRQLHVNAFGIAEPQHAQLQARRRDAEALFAYLAEQRIPADVNHLFSALTGARELADLRLPLGRIPLIEVRNGAMPEAHNERARQVGASCAWARWAGATPTCSRTWRARSPACRPPDEAGVPHGLRAGLCVPAGRSGSYARLTSRSLHLRRRLRRDPGGAAPRRGASVQPGRERRADAFAAVPLFTPRSTRTSSRSAGATPRVPGGVRLAGTDAAASCPGAPPLEEVA